jgi:phage tail sheath gpL-like
MMTISFNQLPASIRVPLFYAEFDNSRAVQGLVEQPFRMLMIGQKLATGTKPALSLELVTSKEKGIEYFGAGSVLSDMLTSFFANETNTEVWACGLDDLLAGVKAIGKLTFGGTPTKAGIASLMVAGQNIKVGISTTDTPTTIAAAAIAAINAVTTCTVAASVNGVNAFEVDLTAKNKGEHGNEVQVSHSYFLGEELPTGVTLAIVQPTGGAGNPDIATVWPVIGEVQYLLMASPFTDASNLTKVETELDGRFGPLRQNDGYMIMEKRGTHGALVSFGLTRNSKYYVIKACIGPSSPWQKAAATAGQVAKSIQADDAVRPFHTLLLTGIFAPLLKDQFTLAERDILLKNGIATDFVDAGGNVLIEGLITTYRLNAFGSPDISYLYLNVPMTLSYLRFSSKAKITQKFGRHKLANDGTRFSPGQAVVTPNVIKAELINLFKQWEERALVEGFDQFKKDLIVERNPNNPNRIDVLMPPDLVNQLVIVGVKIQFLL